jgi:hypothetical protein
VGAQVLLHQSLALQLLALVVVAVEQITVVVAMVALVAVVAVLMRQDPLVLQLEL